MPRLVRDPVARKTQILVSSIEAALPLPAATLSHVLLDDDETRWCSLREGNAPLDTEEWAMLRRRASHLLGWRDPCFDEALAVSNAIGDFAALNVAPAQHERVARYEAQLESDLSVLPPLPSVLHVDEMERYCAGMARAASVSPSLMGALLHAFKGLGLSGSALLALWHDVWTGKAEANAAANRSIDRPSAAPAPNTPLEFCDTVLGLAIGLTYEGARERGEGYRCYPDAAALHRCRHERPLVLCAIPRRSRVEALFGTLPLTQRWEPERGEDPEQLLQMYAAPGLSAHALAALWTSYVFGDRPEGITDNWRRRPQTFLDFVIGIGLILDRVMYAEDVAGIVKQGVLVSATALAMGKGAQYRRQHGFAEEDGKHMPPLPAGSKLVPVVGPDEPLPSELEVLAVAKRKPPRTTPEVMAVRAPAAWKLMQQGLSLEGIAKELGISVLQATVAVDAGQLADWKSRGRDDEVAQSVWHTEHGIRVGGNDAAMYERVLRAANLVGVTIPPTIKPAMLRSVLNWAKEHYEHMQTRSERAEQERARQAGDWTYPLDDGLSQRIKRAGFANKEEVLAAVHSGHIRRKAVMVHPTRPVQDPEQMKKRWREREGYIEPQEMRAICAWVGLPEDFNRQRELRRAEIVAEKDDGLAERLGKAAEFLKAHGYQVVPPTARR